MSKDRCAQWTGRQCAHSEGKCQCRYHVGIYGCSVGGDLADKDRMKTPREKILQQEAMTDRFVRFQVG